MIKFLTGTPSCAKQIMPDGSEKLMEPSGFCYFFTFLVLISELAAIRKHIICESYGMAVIQALVGAVTVYLFYSHCSVCQGWMGFFKTVAIGIILSTIGFRPPNCKELAKDY